MNAREVAFALGGARRAGRGWVARCPAHEDRSPSLSLADGREGRLLARCHAGCEWADILAALRARGLAEGDSSGWTAPDPVKAAHRLAEERAEAVKRAKQAERCWGEARPVAGTVAERYLRGRGITSDLPPTLRFHPECWHGPTAKRHPAMVARVEGGDGFAIHRTYLDARTAEQGRKADVTSPKMMLGATKGGAVRLSGGHRRLVVAEGIETALSLACGFLDGPATVWAALSASGMAALRLPRPPADGDLWIAPDGDETGRAAAHTLAQRAASEGWAVSLMPIPDGADWNELLVAEAAR